MGIQIISAGAGSGKTYRLTQEMVNLLRGGTRASGIIATTFTAKAAAELHERVSTKLLEEGLTEQANDLSNALIGTVHGLGVKLLKRFAFEAGVSPQVDIMAEEDQQIFFNQSLSHILTLEKVEKMNVLCDKLGLTKKGDYDWRKNIREIVDVARANAFSKHTLEESKFKSFESFKQFLIVENTATTQEGIADYNAHLLTLINETINNLEASPDDTKVTKDGIGELKTLRNELSARRSLHWYNWVKITKIKVGAKSKSVVEDLVEFAKTHVQFDDFQKDIRDFIYILFDIATEAIAEFDRFKKQRALIDYTDMEVLVRGLLDDPSVVAVLKEELDLLMVDEFQDTSPIQLDVFLKLSKIAKHSIWVGDPKQSIYGFRGAEPRLMQAILEHVGIKDDDILKDSWRSRPDIVFATNAIFKKAFQDLPVEQIALNPKREDRNLQTDALIHWHFQLDNGGDKRIKPNAEWFNSCIAEQIKVMLEKGVYILPKGEKTVRLAREGDVAIFCRSNQQCADMAENLHRAGLKAAIARTGLLNTAESKLILAVLRYLLNRHDSLAVAEILLLAERIELPRIIEHRLQYLEEIGEDNYDWRWAYDNEFIQKINALRPDIKELSSNEILNLVLEDLDLRRIIAAWGSKAQRLENVDVLRKMSLQYENACNRLHSAATLGGFLLWLAEMADSQKDTQSSGESPDAVNVLTYHKSKGLEYPICIMGSLEQSLRNDVFGIEIMSDTEGVNLTDILGGRWLRFWVSPYADQFRNTELEDRINNSEAKAAKTLAVLAEEARLLYVGITRARDYLIFPTYQGGVTKWLNRAWHHGKEEFPTLETGNDTPFEWGGRYLTKDFEEEWFTKDFAFAEIPTEQVEYMEARNGKQEFKSYKIDLGKEFFSVGTPLKVGDTEGYGSVLPIREDDSPHLIYKALTAYWAACEILPADLSDNLLLAKQIATRFETIDMIDYQWFVRQANSLFDFLYQRFPIAEIARRYPIRGHHSWRLYEVELSFLVENKNGSLVVLLDSNETDTKKVNSEAIIYASRLGLIQKALDKVFGERQIYFYIHFPLLGILAEMK
ncbi:MAG: UvrD-helicase domain-containing protein [Saprospiraceae bacterium]|nr:UvrD-helicase domain-containing protein [Saprospiraceae bacterium]